LHELGFAPKCSYFHLKLSTWIEHPPAHCPHCIACSEASTVTATYWSTRVKYTEFSGSLMGESFWYFPSSHSGWTHMALDAPVLHSSLRSLPSCMPRTRFTQADLHLWLPHPAPFCMKVLNVHTGLRTKHC